MSGRFFSAGWAALGRHQFCNFVGSKSMLQHTLDRADRLTQPERKVTVIVLALVGNRAAVREQADRDGSRSALESRYRGVLFPLTQIRAHDPQATVVIYPSDHFVHLAGKIIEDCLATTRAPTLFDEFLKSLQVCLDARRHHSQCISDIFGETLRGIL